MYTHEKNNALRQYLKRKATSATVPSAKVSSLDQLTDVIKIFDTSKMKDMLNDNTFAKKSDFTGMYPADFCGLENAIVY